jgi:hypothetical protein
MEVEITQIIAPMEKETKQITAQTMVEIGKSLLE